MKALLIRSYGLCWTISITWELTEVSGLPALAGLGGGGLAVTGPCCSCGAVPLIEYPTDQVSHRPSIPPTEYPTDRVPC